MRVLVFIESEAWKAQCLEHDISATGATRGEVNDKIIAAIAGAKNIAKIKAAPSEFEARWAKAMPFGESDGVEWRREPAR